MHLLVSVRNGAEARAALTGGADVIDAKEPRAGALGAVAPDVLRSIAAAVAGAAPVTAALGDASDEDRLARDAAAFVAAGAALVKVGFAGAHTRERMDTLLRAAVRGAGASRVIAVAYADYPRVDALSPDLVVEAAAGARVAGVLMDTADKSGPGSCALVSPHALQAWVMSARSAGLLVAIAGQIGADDFAIVSTASADVVGVRGAACEGGRVGRVTAARVRALRVRLDRTAGVSMEPPSERRPLARAPREPWPP